MKDFPIHHLMSSSMKLILIVLLLLNSCGCGILKKSVTKQQQEILSRKVELVKETAYATDLYLVETNIVEAIKSNDKTINIVGQPSLKQIQNIKDSVVTTNFRKLDQEIIKVQAQEVKVQNQLEAEAAKVPELENELKEYKSWWGLGGVIKSIKRFTVFILIGCIGFFVLKLASKANPITAALFSIVETVVSYFIKAVHLLIPKAVESVSTSGAALKKVVQAVENNQTINDMKAELKEKMNDAEKVLVKDLKP